MRPMHRAAIFTLTAAVLWGFVLYFAATHLAAIVVAYIGEFHV